MATLIIPGAYMVSINAESGGQAVSNVIGVRGVSGAAEGIAAAVETAWMKATGPIKYHPSQYLMRSVRVTDLSSATGEVVERSVAGPGLAVGGLATNASCAVISYTNGSRSRSGRGRLYHGPLLESQMDTDGRHLTEVNRIALEGAYLDFKATLQAASFGWVVISRKLATFTDVGTPKCQSLSGTQRRRLR